MPPLAAASALSPCGDAWPPHPQAAHPDLNMLDITPILTEYKAGLRTRSRGNLTTPRYSRPERASERTLRRQSRVLQRMMKVRNSEMIEELTGRKVPAFLSHAHVEPDLTVEMFLLDGRYPGSACSYSSTLPPPNHRTHWTGGCCGGCRHTSEPEPGGRTEALDILEVEARTHRRTALVELRGEWTSPWSWRLPRCLTAWHLPRLACVMASLTCAG